MNTKKVIQLAVVALIIFVITSCSKQSSEILSDKKGANVFTADNPIGKWVSNKNDTISFFKRNNINLTDAASGSPGPGTSEIEFTYSDNKLFLKDGTSIPVTELRKLQTFNWIEIGKRFNVESRDIFSYRSSNSIPLIFTKQ